MDISKFKNAEYNVSMPYRISSHIASLDTRRYVHSTHVQCPFPPLCQRSDFFPLFYTKTSKLAKCYFSNACNTSSCLICFFLGLFSDIFIGLHYSSLVYFSIKSHNNFLKSIFLSVLLYASKEKEENKFTSFWQIACSLKRKQKRNTINKG